MLHGDDAWTVVSMASTALKPSLTRLLTGNTIFHSCMPRCIIYDITTITLTNYDYISHILHGEFSMQFIRRRHSSFSMND